jgi:haloalkane dehalogenase
MGLLAGPVSRRCILKLYWGGLIGLRLVAAFPDRFARVVTANAGLPVGDAFSPAFELRLNFSQTVPELPVGQIANMSTARDLSPAEQAAYVAPFPGESYKAGARIFPALVPITPNHRDGGQRH